MSKAKKVTVKFEDFSKTSSNFDWNFMQINLLSARKSINLKEKLIECVKFGIFIAHIFNIFTYGFLTTSGFFDVTLDLGKITFGISFSSTMTMMCVKYACVYLNQPKLRDIVQKLPENYV